MANAGGGFISDSAGSTVNCRFWEAPMTAQLIDGNAIAKSIELTWPLLLRAGAALDIVSGLAVILVGNDPASEVYVKGKRRDCEQVGVNSTALHCPKYASIDSRKSYRPT